MTNAEKRNRNIKIVSTIIIVVLLIVVACLVFYFVPAANSFGKDTIEKYSSYKYQPIIEDEDFQIDLSNYQSEEEVVAEYESNGYILSGFVDSEGNSYTIADAVEFSKDRKHIDLIPVKTEKEYTISFKEVGIKSIFAQEDRFNSVRSSFDSYESTDDCFNIKYTVKSENIELPELNNLGYTFLGYFDGDNKISGIVPKETIADKEITIKWEPIVYTITYSKDSVYQSYNNNVLIQSYTIESGITFDNTLQNNGYTLDGYYYGNDKINGFEAGTIGDKEITIKWTPIVYAIDYEVNSIYKSYSNNVLPATYTIETGVEFDQSIVNTGYTLNGYYYDNKNIIELKPGTFGNKTVSLRWDPIVYTITYSKDSVYQSYNNNVLIQSYTIESGITFDNTLQNNGYTLDGYYYGNDKINGFEAGTIGDKAITIKWDPVEYAITYVKDSVYQSYSNNDLQVTYTIETGAIFNQDLQNAGYTLNGYYDGSNKVNGYEVGTYGDKEVTIKWTPIEYTITYKDAHYVNGVKVPTENTINYNIEDVVVCDDLNYSAIMSGAYATFDGWYDDSNNKIDNISHSTGDLILGASWSLVGSGTEVDPYLIYNEDQLKTLFTQMDKYYKLMDNITITYEWTPVGTSVSPFIGVFDGNGKTLTINEIEATIGQRGNNNPITEFALFAYIGTAGVVKNVNMASTTGSWASNFTLERYASLCLENRGQLLNCNTNVELTISASCTNVQELSSSKYGAAGICYFNYGVITECSNNGSINVSGTGSCVIAGIAMENRSANAIITDCYANKELSVSASIVAYAARYVFYMERSAKLRVTKGLYTASQFVDRYCDTTGITVRIDGDLIDNETSPYIPKPVVKNNCYNYAFQSAEATTYIYYMNLEYSDPDQVYLETWFSIEEATGTEEYNLDGYIYKLIGSSGNWENLTNDNAYGWYCLKKYNGKDEVRGSYTCGGYAYGYDGNHKQITKIIDSNEDD